MFSRNKKTKLPSTEVGPTTLRLTHDLDIELQFSASYGQHLLTCKISRSMKSEDSLETNGQTGRRTDRGACITPLANADSNNPVKSNWSQS